MDNDKDRQREMDQARKLVGFIVAVVIIFFAQRDLRRRSPELVRGSMLVWRLVAMVPPGAVAYLLFGRRRIGAAVPVEPKVSIAA